jgi:hypothetical protein
MTTRSLQHQRHNRPNNYGVICLTPITLERPRSAAAPPSRRAPTGPRPGTGNGLPPSPRTGRQPPRRSTLQAATAPRHARHGHRPGPRPSSGGGPRTRTRGQTTDETGASPGQYAANRRHRVHLTTRSNAYAERWVRTVRRECLDQLLIVGGQQLARVLRTHVEHYNRHRPHRSLGHMAPVASVRPESRTAPAFDQLHRRDLLGGLIHEYEPAA